MKNILLLGAGRSSISLIKYLLEVKGYNNFKITISDFGTEFPFMALFPNLDAKYIRADLANDFEISSLVKEADLVISLLPPSMHLAVAKQCIAFAKHFITASYLSDEIRNLQEQAVAKGIVIMMEAGLDPGLDHMSALREIDDIHQQGGLINSFKSYTGGLVAPESDDNPWHYKISWNPRNVVLAGQGTSRFLENNREKIIPYHRLFTNLVPIDVFEKGDFEGYMNRDSLKYQSIYNLAEAHTLIRGTIRQKNFCAGWQHLVVLGMTDDSVNIANSEGMPLADFTRLFLNNENDRETLQNKLCSMLNISQTSIAFSQLEFLGLFSDTKITIANATPAQVVQQILIDKIPLQPNDIDMVVMQHHIQYTLQGVERMRKCSLIAKGENAQFTAMAKTVGLPLGIISKMIVENKIKARGVMLPMEKHIYEHVLEQLHQMGIRFIITEEIV